MDPDYIFSAFSIEGSSVFALEEKKSHSGNPENLGRSGSTKGVITADSAPSTQKTQPIISCRKPRS